MHSNGHRTSCSRCQSPWRHSRFPGRIHKQASHLLGEASLAAARPRQSASRQEGRPPPRPRQNGSREAASAVEGVSPSAPLRKEPATDQTQQPAHRRRGVHETRQGAPACTGHEQQQTRPEAAAAARRRDQTSERRLRRRCSFLSSFEGCATSFWPSSPVLTKLSRAPGPPGALRWPFAPHPVTDI